MGELDPLFCFDCGYDLHGLELPRACPECGCVADPAGDVRRVRSWFAGRPAAIGWILRPGRIPPGSWYALFDRGSLQLARKREWLWLWMPALLAAVTVAMGCLITVEYDATFVREMFRLLGDAPDELPKFIGKIIAIMESLDK